ncbi:MAG: metalloregulator ArsR/SmtB family transcription factor [Planctomycetota bacterium]
MEPSPHVRVFGALAHPQRLAVFQLLARAGDDGLAAGAVAQQLALPPSSLSFHLRDLEAAGLVTARRDGRRIVYSVRGDTLRATLWFLGEDCCQGRVDLCPDPTARIRAPERPADASGPAGVLFVCTQNAARSQLAEALLRDRAGARFAVHSAGLRPATVHPLVAVVLREVGVASAGLHSKDLGALLGKQAFAHAFVLCPDAAVEATRRAPFAADQQVWPFADPAAARGSRQQQIVAFRRTRDAIAARLDAWLHELDHPTPRASRSNRKKTA